MEYRELDKSGLRVSVLGLGTWQFGDPTGTYTKQSEDTEFEIVNTALKYGINFFDTAEAYANGEAERALTRALAKTGKKREDYILASKVNAPNLSKEKVIEACERSLTNLNTSYIDLYQIHWANKNIPISDTMEALDQLRKQGKIRAIGISNFGALDTRDAVATGVPIVSNQLPYNLLTRAIEYDIIEECERQGLGILAYSPLAQGLLTGKYQTLEDCMKNSGLCRSRHFDKSRSSKTRHTESGCEEELFPCLNALFETTKQLNESHNNTVEFEITPTHVALSWALRRPSITGLLVGASRPQHVVEAVRALHVNKLFTSHIQQFLTEKSEPVKLKLGKSPDLWSSETRFR